MTRADPAQPALALLIRADASPTLGGGHVLRCLAIAQAWRRLGGTAVFASALMPELLARRLAEEGFAGVQLQVEPGGRQDAEATLALAATQGAKRILVDGYHFDTTYLRDLRRGQLLLGLMDDAHQHGTPEADLLIDGNLFGSAQDYPDLLPGASALLGPRYAPIRDEFKGPLPRMAGGKERTILVSLGGTAPEAVLRRILQDLADIREPALAVALAPGFQGLQGEAPAVLTGHHSLELLATGQGLARHLALADLVICGAGVTCLEAAFLNTPSLAVILAENQVRVARAVEALDLGVNLGWGADLGEGQVARAVLETLDRPRRPSGAPGLIDGRGADRIAAALSLMDIHLRPATAADSQRLLHWANDPTTRAMSFASDPILPETHALWLDRMLTAPDGPFYIAETAGGAPLGQVRFARGSEGQYILSTALAPAHRGRGQGARVIAAACATLPPGTEILAYIRPENAASIRAFARAGFAAPVPALWNGHEALLMIRNKEPV